MEFPSNTNKEKDAKLPKPVKATEKKVEKVISGEALQKKKPLSIRFKHIFFGGEMRSAANYILAEVLLPAVKNMVVDATSKGIERMIYGESDRRSVRHGQSRVQYNSSPIHRSTPRAYLPDQPGQRQARRVRDVSDILLSSRQEAETVLERLNDIIDQFDVASVADLYDLVGLPTTYVDNQWGWVSLQYVNVRQIREGFLIDLPPVEPL